jgi:hypothetical protein
MLERDPTKSLDPRDASRDTPPPVLPQEPPPPAPPAPGSARRHDVRTSESDADNPMIFRSID